MLGYFGTSYHALEKKLKEADATDDAVDDVFLLNCVIEFEEIDPNRCQREERVRHPESKGRQG